MEYQILSESLVYYAIQFEDGSYLSRKDTYTNCMADILFFNVKSSAEDRLAKDELNGEVVKVKIVKIA